MHQTEILLKKRLLQFTKELGINNIMHKLYLLCNLLKVIEAEKDTHEAIFILNLVNEGYRLSSCSCIRYKCNSHKSCFLY